MTNVSLQNGMEIFHMTNGMFQYFLLIDPPRKIRIQTPSIALKLRTHKESRKFRKYTSKTKDQTKFINKPIVRRVWQFTHKKVQTTPSGNEGNLRVKQQKRVRFTDKLNIRQMCVWQFAHAEARKGKWHQFSIDKMHFASKIGKLDIIISPILRKQCQKITKTLFDLRIEKLDKIISPILEKKYQRYIKIKTIFSHLPKAYY